VTIPSFNNIIFAKEKKYFAYIIWRFSFFSSCEKNVFILDRLAAETKITSTWHVQNEWMNEWTLVILKWNKYNCKSIVTEQTYPCLRHPWIVFCQTLNKDCCFVRFILRKMISWCRVCVFGPSHRPSRLDSHVKIYLDLTFPPRRVSGNASRRLCWTLREK